MTHTQSRHPKRWGIRTLLFLLLATVSVLSANLLNAAGNDDYVLLTFAGTVIGLVGAGVSSVRGIRSGGWLPRP